MRGKPFTKGDPRAGRPPGTPNKTSQDARELAQKLVSDPAYLEKLQQRLIEGKLGNLETVLWSYAYGPPPSHPITTNTLFFESLPGFGSAVDDWGQPVAEEEDETP
jgi:hypothetical protein